MRVAGRHALVAVLAIAVTAMMLAGLAVIEPDLPETSPGAIDEEPSGIVAADAEGLTSHQDPQRERLDPVVARSSKVSTLRLRVQRSFGSGSSHYIGPACVEADGRLLFDEVLVNNDALAFDLKGTTLQVRVVAPHHHPVVIDLEPPTAKGWSKKAKLKPTAELSIAFEGLPSSWSNAVSVHVQAAMGETGWFRLERGLRGFHGRGCCVPGEALTWRLHTKNQEAFAVGDVFGEIAPLAVGESRHVVISNAAFRQQQYRLLGPSAELMEFVTVFMGSGRPIAVGRDGTFCVWGTQTERLTIPLSTGTRSEVELLRGEPGPTVYVRPEHRLLGVGLFDRDGCKQKIVSGHSQGDTLKRGVAAMVYAEPVPDVPCFYATPGEPCQPYNLPGFDGRDCHWLSVKPTPEPSLLFVRLTGQRPDDGCVRDLKLCLQHPDWAMTIDPRSEVTIELHRAGVANLGWRHRNESMPTDRQVTLVRGESTILTLPWPTFEHWTGEVEGLDLAGRPESRHRINFGNDRMKFAGWSKPIAGNRFVGWFSPEALRKSPVTVWRVGDLRGSLADIAHCDERNRHLVVRVAEAVRHVRLEVELQGPWSAMMWRPNDYERSRAQTVIPADGCDHRNRRPIRIRQGERLVGVLEAGLDYPERRAVGWFSMDHRQSVVHVCPGNGHWVEVVAKRSMHHIVLEGPDGQIAYARPERRGLLAKVYVPAGTQTLRASFDNGSKEFPIGSQTRIVIK